MKKLLIALLLLSLLLLSGCGKNGSGENEPGEDWRAREGYVFCDAELNGEKVEYAVGIDVSSLVVYYNRDEQVRVGITDPDFAFYDVGAAFGSVYFSDLNGDGTSEMIAADLIDDKPVNIVFEFDHNGTFVYRNDLSGFPAEAPVESAK